MGLDPKLLPLVESVADGAAIAWETIDELSLDAADRPLLPHLRLVASVGAVYRGLAAADAEATIGRAVGSRWRGLELMEKVGEGAFGEVYRAFDPRLQRHVALKLAHLPAPQAAQLARILDEARMLARVQHPNVVAVHGADVESGRMGLWMELVRGRTLSQILHAQGTFGAQEAALIGEDVCRALAAVHREGLVHRDVKASNVMREEGGRIVLMDFGSAVARPPAGQLAGTLLYMAPELLAGGEATVRSDIYSLGVLLHHLVTLDYPVRGTSLDEIKDGHAAGHRLRLHDARPEIPDAFVHVVERALDPDPARRFGSAGELLAALAAAASPPASAAAPLSARTRRFSSAAVAAGLVLAAGAALVTLRPAAPPPAAPRSIAVLPFANLTGGDDAYFAEGVADEIRLQLSRLRGVRVIDQASAARHGSNPAAGRPGAGLGVGFLLTGSVRRSGERVRMVARLVDASSSQQLWAEAYDGRLADIFNVQSEVALRVANALKGQLTPEESRLLRTEEVDLEAFNLYLRGRFRLSKRTEPALRLAVADFGAAVAKRPDFARAHAGLADAHVLLWTYGSTPAAELRLAERAATRALELDPGSAEAHASLGMLAGNRFHWQQAEDRYRRALEAQPSYATAHHWYGVLLTQLGRCEEALERMRAAQSLDPLSPVVNTALGWTFYACGRHADAVRQLQDVLELDRSFAGTHATLAESYIALGRYAEAEAALEQAEALTSRRAYLWSLRGYAHARAGRRDQALRVIEDLQRRISGREPVAFAIGTVWAGLDDHAAAMDWLERAVALKQEDVADLKVEPRFAVLRSHPRFAKLLAQIGLAP